MNSWVCGAVMNFIGQSAPDWTLQGFGPSGSQEFSSKALFGNWYVIYWYPRDFSTVCPTEVLAFNHHLEDFEDSQVTLFGCSLDSIETHERWVSQRDIFPEGIHHVLLSDEDGKVTKSFDLIHEASGLPCRGLVIVDEFGKIQHYSQSSLIVGRQPKSILRMVEALKSNGLCSATWQKGDKHIGED
ncbi:MAG: redoxin domain-containing protein [archaeon]|nr:redoxin domain-containing protein [archaeon]